LTQEKSSSSPLIAGRRKAGTTNQSETAKSPPRKPRTRTRPAVQKKPEAQSVPQEEAPKDSPVADKAESRVKPAKPRKSTISGKNTSKTKQEPVDLAALDTEYGRLHEEIKRQETAISNLTNDIEALSSELRKSTARPRLGIFVDVPNLIYGIEDIEIHMGKLLDFLSTDRQLVRAIAYCPISDDPREPIETQKFIAPFINYDYRLVTSPLKRFADGSIKGNCDVEMTVDMLSMAERLDVITLVSGDADFSRAVEAVQSRGVRVEAAAFSGSTSSEIRAISDRYIDLNNVLSEIT